MLASKSWRFLSHFQSENWNKYSRWPVKEVYPCGLAWALYTCCVMHSSQSARPRTDRQTNRHTDRQTQRRAWPQYILRRLRLTHNVMMVMLMLMLFAGREFVHRAVQWVDWETRQVICIVSAWPVLAVSVCEEGWRRQRQWWLFHSEIYWLWLSSHSIIHVIHQKTVNWKVITWLASLEMSGNLTPVRELTKSRECQRSVRENLVRETLNC